ncbi:peptidase M16 [Aurantiacibacter marinus]|uniref:Peptidase M16 n=1 Tax=Aurantiacibacter marinus TaxID=874156 RepID=A0A0H0XKC6_9SPHN|nr:peptidase M16 [Aurantiacibacter marinus]
MRSAILAGQAEHTVPADVLASFPELADSDLPFDTDYRVGMLGNGLRYIVRSNATPPERASVRLWVDFGSAAEGEDERGYAHFIEHMAFNGSTNIPEGEMIRLLEREGLAFGADTNASTGFDTTLYKLDLPRNDLELLDTALMLMRETAGNLIFDDEAVEREKGVILSERRVRDTYQLQSTVDNLSFLYPGSAVSNRMPIGLTETLQAADGDALRALYQRHYRPENMALVIVGDFAADVMEAAIQEWFDDFEGPPRLDPPTFGPVDTALSGQSRIFLDPALSERVDVSRHGDWLDEPDTFASRRDSLMRQIGYAIVSRRLQRISRQEDPPFRGARLGTSEFFREGRTTTLSVQAADGQWSQALAAAQQEYRRALEFGFTQGEIDEQLANARTAFENSVDGAATRSNAAFVSTALGLLRNDRVPITPEAGLAFFEAVAPDLNPVSVMAALAAHLVPLNDPLIRFVGRTAPDGGETEIRSAWETSQTSRIIAGDIVEAAPFAYTDFGAPGEVVADVVDERLGIREVRFANGAMLNLKRTDLDEDSVAVLINIDGGDMLDTRDNPLATAMFSNLLSGGLGAHTLDELQTALAGRRAALRMGSAAETFFVSNVTTPDDLELQLQLMTAAIADPGFRPTGEEQYQRGIDNYFARLSATPSSSLGAQIGAIESDNDPRFSLSPREAFAELSFAKLREDMIERWRNGAMEIAIVGDIDEDQAIDLVAATLGTLPDRESEFRPYEEERVRSFTADRSARTLYHDGEADQALLTMRWPTRDDRGDLIESTRLSLLGRIVRLQLTDTLREELGQTYSPSVQSSQSAVYPGYGVFRVTAQIETGDIAETRSAILATLASIRDDGVTDDMLVRARRPMMESYDNALDTNGGWMGLVDRAQTQSDRIDRFMRMAEALEGLNAEDVRQTALQYLDPDTRLEITVIPRPAPDQ